MLRYVVAFCLLFACSVCSAQTVKKPTRKMSLGLAPEPAWDSISIPPDGPTISPETVAYKEERITATEAAEFPVWLKRGLADTIDSAYFFNRDAEFHASALRFHPNEKMRERMTFDNGKLKGSVWTWDDDGNLTTFEEFDGEQKVGLRCVFDSSERPTIVQVWKRNELQHACYVTWKADKKNKDKKATPTVLAAKDLVGDDLKTYTAGVTRLDAEHEARRQTIIEHRREFDPWFQMKWKEIREANRRAIAPARSAALRQRIRERGEANAAAVNAQFQQMIQAQLPR